MSVRSILDSAMKRQQATIARQALDEALGGQLPDGTKVEELLHDLQQDESLWKVFNGLNLGDLRRMLGASSPNVPFGPTRKRGVTSQRIIDHVAANPGCSRKDIMDAIGIKGGTASSQLRTLRIKGRLRSDGVERDFRYYVAE